MAVCLLVLFLFFDLASAWSCLGAKTTSLMVQDQKIYVVVGVILLILFGLLFYLWRIDQKLSRLERGNNS